MATPQTPSPEKYQDTKEKSIEDYNTNTLFRANRSMIRWNQCFVWPCLLFLKIVNIRSSPFTIPQIGRLCTSGKQPCLGSGPPHVSPVAGDKYIEMNYFKL